MNSDFWWLPECDDGWLVGVAHQEPLRGDDDASSALWDYSSGESGPIRFNPPQITVRSVTDWREQWWNINVHRTLAVTRPDGTSALGPFVVDIDNDYGRDLEDALETTRRAARYFDRDTNVTPADLRFFFSGRKGFNIEVRPSALGLDAGLADSVDDWRARLEELIRRLGGGGSRGNFITGRGTCIDRIYGSPPRHPHHIHPYLRFHNSLNCWVGPDGSQVLRMKMEVTREQLDAPSVDLVRRSEVLAAEAGGAS